MLGVGEGKMFSTIVGVGVGVEVDAGDEVDSADELQAVRTNMIPRIANRLTQTF